MKHAQTVLFLGDGMADEPLAELGGRKFKDFQPQLASRKGIIHILKELFIKIFMQQNILTLLKLLLLKIVRLRIS